MDVCSPSRPFACTGTPPPSRPRLEQLSAVSVLVGRQLGGFLGPWWLFHLWRRTGVGVARLGCVEGSLRGGTYQVSSPVDGLCPVLPEGLCLDLLRALCPGRAGSSVTRLSRSCGQLALVLSIQLPPTWAPHGEGGSALCAAGLSPTLAGGAGSPRPHRLCVVRHLLTAFEYCLWDLGDKCPRGCVGLDDQPVASVGWTPGLCTWLVPGVSGRSVGLRVCVWGMTRAFSPSLEFFTGLFILFGSPARKQSVLTQCTGVFC